MKINNRDEETKEDSLSILSETDVGLIVVDDEHDSCFELELEVMSMSEVFELQLSFSLNPDHASSCQGTVYELHCNTCTTPLKNMGVIDIERSPSQKFGDAESTVDDSMSSNIRRALSCREFATRIRSTDSRLSSATGTFDNDNQPMSKSTDQEHLRVRKASKFIGMINGRVMRLLIKFRSEKIQSTLLSAVRSYQHCVHKWMPHKKSKSSSGKRDLSRRFGTEELDFRSCPGSIASSPCHREVYRDMRAFERDRSVSAAIAHCKLSFDGGKRT